MITVIVILALALALVLLIGSRRNVKRRGSAGSKQDVAGDTLVVGDAPDAAPPSDFTPGDGDFGGAGSSGSWDDGVDGDDGDGD